MVLLLVEEVRDPNHLPCDDLDIIHLPVCGLDEIRVPIAFHTHAQFADLVLVVDPLLARDVLVPTSLPRSVCGVLVPVSFTPVASRRPGPPCFRG